MGNPFRTRRRSDMEDVARLPSCAYRRIVDPGPGGRPYYVCECAGGIPIGTAGEGFPGAADVCGPCNLPSEIALSRRTCLFLVPVRLWEEGRLRTGFSCRWFYNLKPKRLPGEVWMVCLGCPHWFPRPDEEDAIPGMREWIRRVIALYWEPEAAAEASAGTTPDVPRRNWREEVLARFRKLGDTLLNGREAPGDRPPDEVPGKSHGV